MKSALLLSGADREVVELISGLNEPAVVGYGKVIVILLEFVSFSHYTTAFSANLSP